MNNKLDFAKYRRLARIMKIVIKVTYIASVIFLVAGLVVGILLAVAPISSLAAISDTGDSLFLTLDNILMVKINPETTTLEDLSPVFASICFMAAAIGAVFAAILKQLELILGTIKDDKPFAPENSKRLTTIGITLMIGAFIERAGEYLVASTMINTLKLNSLSANFSADSNMILIGFVVLILAGVFKYGCYLQNEYDSTV
ncbi:MAG: DUF2975 domain-containing protein [Lutisporaceae bacterium]